MLSHFSLRTLLLVVLAGALLAGFVAQQWRITLLHAQLASPAADQPVLLFALPATDSDGSSAKLAGYLGGQFVELGDSLALKSRRHTLDVRVWPRNRRYPSPAAQTATRAGPLPDGRAAHAAA